MTTELTMTELLEREAEGRRRVLDGYRRAAAELSILEAFNLVRLTLGHDYGNGQRAQELGRRRNELERLRSATRSYQIPEPELEPTSEIRAAAWRRVGAPRLRRVAELESYRSHTPATMRTLLAWRRVERWAATGEDYPA